MIDRAELERRLAAGVCVGCSQPFTASNVHTAAGWSETKISQLCEDCFDAVTAESDDEPDLDDEFEEALGNCHQFVTDGITHCGAIGSEQCDECPFHDDLGKAVAELPLDETLLFDK
jgi:hypothetical protein